MQTLGKYQLIAEIARGGMGIVYLAVASGPAGFSKLFVIKELKPELVDDGNFFDMFLEMLWARDIATFNRRRSSTNSSPRAAASPSLAVNDTIETRASCPWNRSTVPTRTPGGIRCSSAST